MGVHYYSPPSDPKPQAENIYDQIDDDIEDVGWYLTTGFPIDLQLKFGYQF